MDDLEFIKDQDKWPQWPILPLKKPATYENAFYYADGKLIHANIFRFNEMTEAEKRKVKVESKTPEQLIAEGWQVD